MYVSYNIICLTYKSTLVTEKVNGLCNQSRVVICLKQKNLSNMVFTGVEVECLTNYKDSRRSLGNQTFFWKGKNRDGPGVQVKILHLQLLGT